MRIGNSSHLAPARRGNDRAILISSYPEKRKAPVAGTAGAVTWPPGGPGTR